VRKTSWPISSPWCWRRRKPSGTPNSRPWAAPTRKPKLVLFTDSVQSRLPASAQAAMGPFYCPPNAKVYIDLSFYQELKTRHGAGGDFAEAYVIAMT